MKKILSLIMALTLIIASFACTTVYADDVLKKIGQGGAGTVTKGEYHGRSNVLYCEKTAKTHLYLQVYADMDKLDSSNYQVCELSVWFGENIEKFTFLPQNKNGKAFEISKLGDVVNDGWNDLKFVFRNDTTTNCRAYINGHFIGEFNVTTPLTSTGNEIRIGFPKINYSDATTTATMYIDADSIKLTEEPLEITPDGYAFFNSEQGTQNGALIVAAYNEDGTVAKVDAKSVTDTDTLVTGFPGAYNYKAFLFNSLTDIKPLVNSVSVK